MKYKRMIGGKILELRQKQGLSQSELGEMVGVSNKAVSKWENFESNPDLSLIPDLAKALKVSCDELLNELNDETKSKNVVPVQKRILGMDGTEYRTPTEYEFVSDRTNKLGTPFLHIHIGKGLDSINAKANGTIAIGNRAKGKIAIGLTAKGLLSIGLLSIGLLSIGLLSIGVLAFGILAIGGLALGTFALGAVACGAICCGYLAAGAIAVGYRAYGAIAVGYYAYTSDTGIAIGTNRYIDGIKQVFEYFRHEVKPIVYKFANKGIAFILN